MAHQQEGCNHSDGYQCQQRDNVGLMERADSPGVISSELNEEADGGIACQIYEHNHAVGPNPTQEAHDYEEEEDIAHHFIGNGRMVPKFRSCSRTGGWRVCRRSGRANLGGCAPSPRGGW